MDLQHGDDETAVRMFVTSVLSSGRDDDVVVAVDPGAYGAIALLCGRDYCVVDIPTLVVTRKRTKKLSAEDQIATGKKTKSVDGTVTKFDYAGICRVFDLLKKVDDRIKAALEEGQVQVRGKGSNAYTGFRVGVSYGMWPLFLHARGYPLAEYKPSEWKKLVGLAGKEKEDSRLRAISLFPKAPLLRKKDHDRAEALLLADLHARVQSGKLPSTQGAAVLAAGVI